MVFASHPATAQTVKPELLDIISDGSKNEWLGATDEWMKQRKKADALAQKGYMLFKRDDLEGAEQALLESLKIDPAVKGTGGAGFGLRIYSG